MAVNHHQTRHRHSTPSPHLQLASSPIRSPVRSNPSHLAHPLHRREPQTRSPSSSSFSESPSQTAPSHLRVQAKPSSPPPLDSNRSPLPSSSQTGSESPSSTVELTRSRAKQLRQSPTHLAATASPPIYSSRRLSTLARSAFAVAVNAKLQYAIVEVQSSGDDSSSDNKKKMLGNVLKESKKPFLVVASDLVPNLDAKWGVKLVVRKTLMGSDFENRRYVHPIDNRECLVVIGGEYITTESGTGLVHTAPGHGQEDYVTGLKYGLPLLSPVDDDGNFTEEAGQFSGLHVLGDGNIAVVKHLNEKMSLIMEESYSKLC